MSSSLHCGLRAGEGGGGGRGGQLSRRARACGEGGRREGQAQGAGRGVRWRWCRARGGPEGGAMCGRGDGVVDGVGGGEVVVHLHEKLGPAVDVTQPVAKPLVVLRHAAHVHNVELAPRSKPCCHDWLGDVRVTLQRCSTCTRRATRDRHPATRRDTWSCVVVWGYVRHGKVRHAPGHPARDAGAKTTCHRHLQPLAFNV